MWAQDIYCRPFFFWSMSACLYMEQRGAPIYFFLGTGNKQVTIPGRVLCAEAERYLCVVPHETVPVRASCRRSVSGVLAGVREGLRCLGWGVWLCREEQRWERGGEEGG